MKPTYIKRGQQPLDTTRIALRNVVTPARTGGEIGKNHRRKNPLPAWLRMCLATAASVGLALAAAAFTAAATNP